MDGRDAGDRRELTPPVRPGHPLDLMSGLWASLVRVPLRFAKGRVEK